jgi:hypothetical protein
MCWLLGVTQRDRWMALVGVDLEQIVVVPDGRGAAVPAGVPGRYRVRRRGPLRRHDSERRKLLARVRQCSAILPPASWEGAAQVFNVEQAKVERPTSW